MSTSVLGKTFAIIRSIFMIGFFVFLFLFAGMKITDTNNGLLSLAAVAPFFYFVLELLTIVYRLIRFHNVDDSSKQHAWVTFQGNSQVDFRVLSYVRRAAVIGVIASIVCVALGRLSVSGLFGDGVVAADVSGIFTAFLRWSICALIFALLMTFVKCWYVMYVNWEGGYSPFTIFGKYIVGGLTNHSIPTIIITVAIIAFTVVGVMSL